MHLKISLATLLAGIRHLFQVVAVLLVIGNAQPAFAQAATSPAAATAAAPAPNAGGVTPSVPEVKKKEPLPVSIFFTPEEMQRMRAAFVAFEKSKKVKISDAENKANDFLNQLTDSEPKVDAPLVEKMYVYPQFFLNSLVFHGHDDWVVLVNNQRFSAKNMESEELKILAVDNETVSLEWKPKKLEHVMESWEKNRNTETAVDSVLGTVRFTLRPNQTFSSYNMRVLEGKVRPVMIMLKPDTGVADDATDADGKKTAGDKKTDDGKRIENITTDDIKNDVGVKGLNKTYKRIGLE